MSCNQKNSRYIKSSALRMLLVILLMPFVFVLYLFSLIHGIAFSFYVGLEEFWHSAKEKTEENSKTFASLVFMMTNSFKGKSLNSDYREWREQQ